MPPLQKLQQFMRRLQPEVSAARAGGGAHQHAQAASLKGTEGILVGLVVTEISHGRFRAQFS